MLPFARRAQRWQREKNFSYGFLRVLRATRKTLQLSFSRLPGWEDRHSIAQTSPSGNVAMKNDVLNKKPEPASNKIVWSFDPGKDSIGDVPRPSDGRGWRAATGEGCNLPDEVNKNLQHEFGASLLIPAEFAETKTAAGRRRMWRTRQAHSPYRPSPTRGDMIAAASGKEAPYRSSAAVPGCGFGRRLAASSIAGRDARPTRRRDDCATRFTQDYAAPTALGRIELKIPIKFSTRFGNGRIQAAFTN